MLGEAPAGVAALPPRVTRRRATIFRDPDSVGEEELRSALAANEYVLVKTAPHLRLSRSSVYELMEKYGIPKAGDLTREQIEAAMERCQGNPDVMAQDLAVSSRGLKNRMKILGLR